MKKLKYFLTIFLILFFSLNLITTQKAHADVNDFVIESFAAEYKLSREDSSHYSKLTIKETITANFPNYNQNHGIERAIPTKYGNNSLNQEIQSVTDATGNPYKYSTRESNDNLILRIGDASVYVHGVQTYVINYSVSNIITFYQDHDELYWDVNGDDWKQPILKTTAVLQINDKVAENLLPNKKCFTGKYGSKESSCTISAQDNKIINITSNRTFESGENLSFVIGFQPQTFTPVPINWTKIILKVLYLFGFIILPPLIALIIMLRLWLKSGRDPKNKNVIIPQYTVPKNDTVALSCVVLKEKLLSNAISATIIELAVLNFIKINQLNTDGKKTFEYELVLSKLPTNLSPFQNKVLNILFSEPLNVGQTINLNKQKNKFAKKLLAISDIIEQSAVDKGYFSFKPSLTIKKYTKIGSLIFVAAAAILMFFHFVPAMLGLTISALLVMFIGSKMPARTLKGVEAKNYLLGLKQ